MSQTHPIEGFLSGLVRQFTARPDTVDSELENLRMIRRRTFALIHSVSEAQGTFVGRPGSWSVAQVLDHVVLTEALYRDAIKSLFELARQGRTPEIKYTLADIDVSIPLVPQAALSVIEIPLDFANRFIPAVVRQTVIRFPVLAASTPSVAVPRPDLTMSVMRDRLLESAIQLGELLAAPLPGDPRKMTISHPILGLNNVLDILGIMAAHEERHQSQIRNVLDDRRLPRS
jgi:hypothetical protein